MNQLASRHLIILNIFKIKTLKLLNNKAIIIL
jgi:hypothetical protein